MTELEKLQRALALYFDAKAAYEDAEAKATAAVKIYHDAVDDQRRKGEE